MSGIVQNNTVRSSGTIAVAAGGLNWDSAVITASTLSAEAGKGYFINTTSNTCTITLPSAAEVGDQIVFVDYARTWGTNKIIIDSNGLNYQGGDDTYDIDYDTSGETLDIVYSGATKGWIPQNDDTVADAPVSPPTQKAIFTFGNPSITNLVSSTGVIAADVTQVGTSKSGAAAGTYGGDKAVVYGGAPNDGGALVGETNLISNTGVVGSTVAIASGVTARADVNGSTYGFDKVIVVGGYGASGAENKYNLINNVGVVAADATLVPTGRAGSGGSQFGSSGQAIFAFGTPNINISFIVTNVGVPGADRTGVGTARKYVACASFGGDRCVYAYGSNNYYQTVSNKVSNTGVVASDTSGVGTSRLGAGGTGYGGDKGMIAYGQTAGGSGNQTNVSNLVNTSGDVAADRTGVGTAKQAIVGVGFSQSA